MRRMSQHVTWGPANPVLLSLAGNVQLDLDRVVDIGDVSVADADASDVARRLCGVVEALPDGVVPCVLGGDHSVTLGSVTALAAVHPDLRVVQFDQHLDVQTWGTDDIDPLFNTNVMSHLADFLGAGRCTQVGIAPFAAVERDHVERARVALRDVGVQLPTTSATDASVTAAVGSAKSVYISVDVDVIGAAEMSSTAYPAVAGLAVRELLTLIDAALEGNILVGFDVVEFAADRADRSDQTLADGARASLIVLHLLQHALHSSRDTDG